MVERNRLLPRRPRVVAKKRCFPSGDCWHSARAFRVYGALNVDISIESRTEKGRPSLCDSTLRQQQIIAATTDRFKVRYIMISRYDYASASACFCRYCLERNSERKLHRARATLLVQRTHRAETLVEHLLSLI